MNLGRKLLYQATIFLLALAILSPSLFGLSLVDHHSEVSVETISVQDFASACEDEACFAAQGTESHHHSGMTHKHDEDCHCSGHRTNCGHAMTYLMAQQESTLSFPLLMKSVFLCDYSVKAGPVLEGPFQPPRV